MEICRACMNGNELFRLNDTYLESYNLLTNLSVRLGDSLPQFICKICWDTVEAFTKFRNECINTENSLCSVVNEPVVKTETDVKIQDEDIKEVEVAIKQEFDDGDDDVLFEDGNDSDTDLIIKAEEEDTDLLWSSNGRPKRKCTNRVASPPAVTVEKRKQPKKTTKKIKLKTGSGKTVSEIKFPRKVKVKQTSLNNKEDSQLLSCGLCKNKYDNRDILYEHLEKHKQDTNCSLCYETFKTWQRLISHRVKHIDESQWRCHLCWKRIANEANVEYHYYKKHGDMKEFPGLKCNVCPKMFLNPLQLHKHASGIHSGKKYICDYCSKVANLKQNLVVHIRTHQVEKLYSCEPCGFSYKSLGGLKDHKLRKHSTTTVECKPCTRLFADQSKYDQHKCPVKPTICPVCGKKFVTYKMYTSHIRRTHSDKRYACSRCPASFKTSTNLRIHCDKHDGFRRYRCKWPSCPLAFYSGSVMNKHMRVHTGEKPYVCTVCNKGFTGNNNLKVHMRVHGIELVKKRDLDTNDVNVSFYN